MKASTTSGGMVGRYVTSVRTNQFVVDAGPNRGGTAEAPTPGEYFLAGICSCAVVVMSGEARRLGIAFASIDATAELVRAEDGHMIAGINLDIAVRGMSQAEADTLLAIYVDECPVYRVVNQGTVLRISLNVTTD